MKRIWSILLAVLLGALVVGLGTGYFLYLANKDRQILADQVDLARLQAQTALIESQKAIEEANNKVTSAGIEIDKAQTALKALTEERLLIEQAEPLTASLTKKSGWSTALSSHFGISLDYPVGSEIISNDNTSLIIAQEKTSDQSPWFKLIPYSSSTYSFLADQITSSTPIAYFIDGRLLAGKTGIQKNSVHATTASILNLYKNGTTTHLLWISDPPPFKTNAWQKAQIVLPKEILSTLNFK